ncbi:MAG: ribosome maturation factor RimM [Rubricoccaceae bacterium]|nr:ribosome maturation factor RimM [Rubricoccaceae bacterium]
MSAANLLLMGSCGRAHGVRGEIKVFPETDDPQRLVDLKRVFVGRDAESAEEFAVQQARLQPLKGRILVLLKLQGIDDREAADEFRNARVYAREEDLPPLQEGEVYVHDLIGLSVINTTTQETIGTVADILEGAQNLLIVSREDQADVLIPDVPEIVLDVDLTKKVILVDPPEGLIE